MHHWFKPGGRGGSPDRRSVDPTFSLGGASAARRSRAWFSARRALTPMILSSRMMHSQPSFQRCAATQRPSTVAGSAPPWTNGGRRLPPTNNKFSAVSTSNRYFSAPAAPKGRSCLAFTTQVGSAKGLSCLTVCAGDHETASGDSGARRSSLLAPQGLPTALSSSRLSSSPLSGDILSRLGFAQFLIASSEELRTSSSLFSSGRRRSGSNRSRGHPRTLLRWRMLRNDLLFRPKRQGRIADLVATA
jgi:hypothetical protein